VNNVLFTNPHNIVVANGYAMVNQSNKNYYLHANPLKSLLSQELATLMFEFQSLPGGDQPNINFVFSTYKHGHGKHRNGYLLRGATNKIFFEINGPNLDSSNTRTVNTLHSISEDIVGGPNIYFDAFCHMIP